MGTPRNTAVATKPKDEALDADFLGAEMPKNTGQENLDAEDFAKPLLILCQANTPQRKKQNEDIYIEGLDEGQFFNLITSQIYGGEIEIIPVHVSLPYAREYDDKGKVIDFNVPLDSDKLQGWTDDNGVYHKPTAKRQLDYTCLLPAYDLEPVIWTAKGAGRGTAKQMNIACRAPIVIGDKRWPKPPSFARAFTLTAGPSRGEHDNWVTNLGIPRLVTKREFAAAKALLEELTKGQTQEDKPPF